MSHIRPLDSCSISNRRDGSFDTYDSMDPPDARRRKGDQVEASITSLTKKIGIKIAPQWSGEVAKQVLKKRHVAADWLLVTER